MNSVFRGAFALALLATLAGCAAKGPPLRPPGSRMHVVQPGDNVWRISQRYDSSVEAIRRANRLGDVTQIRVGQRLVVPTGIRRRPAVSAKAWTRSDARGTRGGPNAFAWPVRGDITSRYGFRRGAHHDGLDIAARRGSDVLAAEAGRVIHSGNQLAGYGNLIIVKHSGPYSTVYAHNRRNLVGVGDFVEKGQKIAEVGATGRASAPHLHFEVRRDGRARDPLHYLP